MKSPCERRKRRPREFHHGLLRLAASLPPPALMNPPPAPRTSCSRIPNGNPILIDQHVPSSSDPSTRL